VTDNGRLNFWQHATRDKVSLISKDECSASDVTPEACEAFLAEKTEEKPPVADNSGDADNLLDEME